MEANGPGAVRPDRRRACDNLGRSAEGCRPGNGSLSRGGGAACSRRRDRALGPPRYDAEDSYYNPGESAVTVTTVDTLTRRWSVPLRQADPACGRPTAPLVADSRVVAGRQVVTGGRLYTVTGTTLASYGP